MAIQMIKIPIKMIVNIDPMNRTVPAVTNMVVPDF